MLKSNWRGHVALGGITSFALLLVALVLYLPDNAGSIEKYREHKQASREYPKDEDASRESRSWLRGILENGRPKIAAPQSEQPKTDSGEYTTALDLSAQWATAIAAAEMVSLTRLQLLFGLAGLMGLGFTIYYTRQTARAAIEAANAAADQTKTLQRQFAATHRPRIRVKHVWLKSEVWQDEVIKVQVIVVNSGESDALIDSFKVYAQIIKIDSTLPAKPVFPKGEFKVSDLRIASGITLELPEIETLAPSDKENAGIRDRVFKLYCYGVVQYWDSSKTHFRTTAFCRELMPPFRQGSYLDVGRFATLKEIDSDYEYED